MATTTARAAAAIAALLLAIGGLSACGDDGGGDGDALDAGGLADLGATGGDDWTQAELDELELVEVPGFTGGERLEAPNRFVRAYVGPEQPDGSAVAVRVAVANCDPFACFDLDAPTTPEQADNLLSTLPRTHIDNPGLVFEHGTRELAPGYEGFAVYKRSFVATDGGTATVNGATALFHDGKHLIELDAYVQGGPTPRSDAGLEAQLSREEAEAAIDDVFAAFADRFDEAD